MFKKIMSIVLACTMVITLVMPSFSSEDLGRLTFDPVIEENVELDEAKEAVVSEVAPDTEVKVPEKEEKEEVTANPELVEAKEEIKEDEASPSEAEKEFEEVEEDEVEEKKEYEEEPEEEVPAEEKKEEAEEKKEEAKEEVEEKTEEEKTDEASRMTFDAVDIGEASPSEAEEVVEEVTEEVEEASPSEANEEVVEKVVVDDEIIASLSEITVNSIKPQRLGATNPTTWWYLPNNNEIHFASSLSSGKAMSSVAYGSFVVPDKNTYNSISKTNITKAVFDEPIQNLVNTQYWLYNFTKLTEIRNLNYLDTSKVTNMCAMFYNLKQMQTLDLSCLDFSSVQNMNSMFAGCNYVKKIKLGNTVTSNLTNPAWMFGCCYNLTGEDLFPCLNTSKATTLEGMFDRCVNLNSEVLKKIDTRNVTNMRRMFYSFSSSDIGRFGGKTTLDLSSFDFSKVTNMEDMFWGGSGLTEIKLGNANTSKVQNFNNAFYDCSNLNVIYSTDFSLSSHRSSTNMFYNCSKLPGYSSAPHDATGAKHVYKGGLLCKEYYLFSKLWSQNSGKNKSDFTKITFEINGINGCTGAPTSYNKLYEIPDSRGLKGYIVNDTELIVYSDSMYKPIFMDKNVIELFAFATNLAEINHLPNLSTYGATDMSSMFRNCSSLTSLDLSSFVTSQVTNMSLMFSYCESLTSLDLSNFDTSNVNTMNSMFSYCKKLTLLDISKFNTSQVEYMNSMFEGCAELVSLNISSFNTGRVRSMDSMFYYCSKLTSLVLGSNTSNVEYMNSMFEGCKNLTSLDLSNFDTSNVCTMNSMFASCSGLTLLDLGKFDTANVTDMSSMFASCSHLTSLDLSNFNTEQVKNMSDMFMNCSSLTFLDLSSFNTSNVTDMSYMFYCYGGETLSGISKFNTSKVTNMAYMFYCCDKLTSLELNFDTSQVSNTKYMFSNCPKLKSINSDNFVLKSGLKSQYMFANSSSLMDIDTGDQSLLDASYAKQRDEGGVFRAYTITVNTPSGSYNIYEQWGVGIFDSMACKGEKLTKLDVPVKDGYIFKGFIYNTSITVTDENGNFVPDALNGVLFNSPCTIEPIWEVAIHEITINTPSGKYKIYEKENEGLFATEECEGEKLSKLEVPVNDNKNREFKAFVYGDSEPYTKVTDAKGNISYLAYNGLMFGTNAEVNPGWSYKADSITLLSEDDYGNEYVYSSLYRADGKYSSLKSMADSVVVSNIKPSKLGYSFTGFEAVDSGAVLKGDDSDTSKVYKSTWGANVYHIYFYDVDDRGLLGNQFDDMDEVYGQGFYITGTNEAKTKIKTPKTGNGVVFKGYYSVDGLSQYVDENGNFNEVYLDNKTFTDDTICVAKYDYVVKPIPVKMIEGSDEIYTTVYMKNGKFYDNYECIADEELSDVITEIDSSEVFNTTYEKENCVGKNKEIFNILHKKEESIDEEVHIARWWPSNGNNPGHTFVGYFARVNGQEVPVINNYPNYVSSVPYVTNEFYQVSDEVEEIYAKWSVNTTTIQLYQNTNVSASITCFVQDGKVSYDYDPTTGKIGNELDQILTPDKKYYNSKEEKFAGYYLYYTEYDENDKAVEVNTGEMYADADGNILDNFRAIEDSLEKYYFICAAYEPYTFEIQLTTKDEDGNDYILTTIFKKGSEYYTDLEYTKKIDVDMLKELYESFILSYWDVAQEVLSKYEFTVNGTSIMTDAGFKAALNKISMELKEKNIVYIDFTQKESVEQ